MRTTILKNTNEINLVWAMRKAGLSLLTGCKGAAKPVTCIEDTAVRPEQFAHSIGPIDQEFMAKLPELHQKAGMDPTAVGEKVLAGIRRNDLYIFPHPEFRAELREIFDARIRQPDWREREDIDIARNQRLLGRVLVIGLVPMLKHG